jgi:hypothetical protein
MAPSGKGDSMKKFVVLFVASALFGCSRIETDYGGSASYYIKNNRTETIKIDYDRNSSGFVEVNAGETELLYSDFIIGINPQPSDSFAWIKIYDSSNSILIDMSIINNGDWIQEKMFTESFGLTNYTYEVN